MFYYDVQTKDGRNHCGCYESKEELLKSLAYFELTYDNPNVISVRVYEKP